MQFAGGSWRGSDAPMRVEPPPDMKRRPCGGGASDFDPAGIEMVTLNGWIISRCRPPYKAAQGSCWARSVPHIISITVMRRAFAKASIRLVRNRP
jgi:hypothetical protein